MRTFTRSLFLLLCWGSTSWLLAQPGTATGTRFHLAYMANYAGNPVQALNVFVSSHQDAVGTLSIPGFGFTQGFTVVAGTTTTLTLPPAFMCTVSEFAESKGVLVETDVPVSVQALNFEQYTADGTNVWPEEMLGRDYFVMAYKGLDGTAGLNSEFLIVSTVDSIDVTITPSVVTATGRPAGVPFTVTLGAHQTYLVSALLEADDLTGSRIVAEVPQGLCDGIAVFGGSRCPNVPTGCYACDHLYEQLPPLSAWGTSYFSVPFTGPSSYTLRALASEDNTTLTYNGTPYSLDMGEVVEWNSVTTAVYIEADKPVSVAQYMEGTVCAQQGDPSMLMLSAEDQGVDQAIFSTVVSTVITSHRMGLVTDAINAGAVLLDGVAIPAASFTPYIQRPDKAYADVLLTQGSHTLSAPGPFLAHSYGFGAAESYAQGIGSALPPALGQDSIICHPGGPITLDAPPGLIYPYWYDPSDPSDTLALGAQYTFTPGGDVVVAVGDTGLAVCASGRQYHLELSITATAVLGVSADPVCAHHAVQVGATLVPPSPLSLFWEQGNGLPDAFGDTITVQPLENTWYTVHFTTPFGCWQLSDSIEVHVQSNTLIGASATASGAGTCQGDSVQLTATAEEALAFDTFTDGYAPWWSNIVGGTVGSGCGPLTDEHLVFDAGGTRSATTQPFDLSGGGAIQFDLFIGNGTNGCDDAEGADDVALEYSTNNGGTWIPDANAGRCRVRRLHPGRIAPTHRRAIAEHPVAPAAIGPMERERRCVVDRQCGGDRQDARCLLCVDPCGRVERSLGLHPGRIASEHDPVHGDAGERSGRLPGSRLGSCASWPTIQRRPGCGYHVVRSGGLRTHRGSLAELLGSGLGHDRRRVQLDLRAERGDPVVRYRRSVRGSDRQPWLPCHRYHPDRGGARAVAVRHPSSGQHPLRSHGPLHICMGVELEPDPRRRWPLHGCGDQWSV
ncbi:MAG: hypothetical protein IPO12_13145 [Flavobacteriales bacterium]|nr:hypothetical protein [Flavobacteriales bacterium]